MRTGAPVEGAKPEAAVPKDKQPNEPSKSKPVEETAKQETKGEATKPMQVDPSARAKEVSMKQPETSSVKKDRLCLSWHPCSPCTCTTEYPINKTPNTRYQFPSHFPCSLPLGLDAISILFPRADALLIVFTTQLSSTLNPKP